MMEEKKIKRIGVLTSGGDAPGMNAAIRAVVRTAADSGVECLGIRRGFNGLINGDIIPMSVENTRGLITRGGTMLYTARCPEFETEQGFEKAQSTCKYLGMDGIIVIGGDGTFRGARALAQAGISTVGIPATIDNDIACTYYSIGFDTACNTALDSIDRLRDTMQSHERCSVVEVMGHNAGHLALYVGIACGASAILVPERKLDFQHDVIEKIRKARILGRTNFTIIVSEGVISTQEAADRIKQETGLETRVTILGHVQRGGSPTARDRVTATRMGMYAVKIMLEGKTNRVVSSMHHSLQDLDITEALEMKKDLQEETYRAMLIMTKGG